MTYYDRWKLDSGEGKPERAELEPEKEIHLPETCQGCLVEYELDEPDATYGFCGKCNREARAIAA